MEIKGKILVTGRHGFLGRFLVKKLLEKGIPESSIFTPRSHELDLRIFKNCLAAVEGKDLVIHAAAVTGGSEFHRNNPGKIFYDNLMMGVQLMEASRVAGVKKFVSLGSVTEYPENAPLPLSEASLWQGPLESLHAPYSFAKLISLVQGEAYRREYSFHAIHLILTNMYGPGFSGEKRYVIESLITKIMDVKTKKENVLEVWGTGNAKREFLYAEDAAEGIVLAAEHYDEPDPLNIGTGKEISIRDLVQRISALLKFKGEIKWDTSKPDGIIRRVLDVSVAERKLGFAAQTDINEGLRKTIEWYNSRI